VNELIAVTHNPEVAVGAAILLLLALLFFWALRATRPDPEMARLLRLLNNLPRQKAATAESLPSREVDEDGRGPLGPSGFTLLTAHGAGRDDEDEPSRDRLKSRPASVSASRTKGL
jgi:hypothetical protein